MGVDCYGVGRGFEMAAHLAKNPRLGPPPVQGEEEKTGSRKIGHTPSRLGRFAGIGVLYRKMVMTPLGRMW